MLNYLKILILTLILIFGSFLFYSNVQAEDNAWPMFQNNIGHTGRSPFLGPGFSETLLVETLIEGEGGDYFNTPVIDSSGVLYFTARIEGKEGVYAFYPDGTKKWYYPGALHMTGPVTLTPDGDVLFCIHIERYQKVALVMLNSDGSLKWEKIFIDYYPVGYPVIDNDGIIYFFADNNPAVSSNLVALDSVTKEIDWTYELEGSMNGSSPTVAQDGIIYFGNKDILYALNPDGSENWTRKFIPDCKYYNCNPTVAIPVIGDDGTIYVVVKGESDWRNPQAQGTYSHFHVIDPEDPMVDKWEKKFTGIRPSIPALDSNGNIYIASWRYTIIGGGISNLIGFNSQGDLIINEQLNGYGHSELIVVDSENNIYVLRTSYSSTRLHIFNVNKPEKQRIVNFTFRYFTGNPSLGNNRTLYIGAREKLYAIGPAVETTNVAVILAEPNDVPYDSTPKTYQPCKLLPEKFYPNGRDKEYFQDLTYCVADYHKENSFGKINLNFTIYDNNGEWFKTNKNEQDYLGKEDEFVKDAINLVQNESIDLSDYDMVIITHSGTSYQKAYHRLWNRNPQKLWTETWTPDDQPFGHPPYKIIIAEKDPFGFWIHEVGHIIGVFEAPEPTMIPDLYKMGNVNKWDLMASGSWNNGILFNKGTNPPYMSSYTKEFLGWLNYDIYPKSAYGEYWINSLETSEYGDTVFRYNLSDDTNDESQKYYILEARNRNLKTWDSSLPGLPIVDDKNLVLYYVDTKGLPEYGYVSEGIEGYQEGMMWNQYRDITIPGSDSINDGVLNPLINEIYRDLNNLVKFSAITDRSINDDYEIQTRIEEITYKSFSDKFWGVILKPSLLFKQKIKKDSILNSVNHSEEIWLATISSNLQGEGGKIWVPVQSREESMREIKIVSLMVLIPIVLLNLLLILLNKKFIPRWKLEKTSKIIKVAIKILWIIFIIVIVVSVFLLVMAYTAPEPDKVLRNTPNNNLSGISTPSLETTVIPDLDLHLYTDDGKHIGMNYQTGQYEIEIEGAIVSGDNQNSPEWIFIPKEITDYHYVVSSYDNQKFLEGNPEIAQEIEDTTDSYEVYARYIDSESGIYTSETISEEIDIGESLEQPVKGTIDISVSSAVPLSVSGDANGDCKVNVLDLTFIRNKLGQDVNIGVNQKADVNNDGKINILDFVVVRNNLGKTCDFSQKTWPIPGDANLDCKVNIQDLIFIQRKFNQDPNVEDNWQADVNQDNKINILDLIFIRNNFGASCE